MKPIHFISLLFLIGLGGISLISKSDSEFPRTWEHPSLTLEEINPTAEPFDIMMQVLTHQRCVNCHPAGDRPHQGDESRVHNFNVQRGPDGHGIGIMQCETCHHSENNLFSGVPGAPHWHLAPKSMAWEGLNRVEIAKAMLDRSKNGGRSLQEIGKHLTEDHLVMWAFEPGINNEGEPRSVPPVSREDFIQAVKEWVATGGPIPTE